MSIHELSSEEEPTTWVFEPESFAPLAKLQGGHSYGIVPDHLGSPHALYDEAGALAWRAQLDVWGIAKTDVAKTRQPWRFPGQYDDDEIGLHYNRFRYYDPQTGRYIARDPIGLRGGYNLFAYVPDPLTLIDPFGLACDDPRNLVGVATGGESLRVVAGRWLRGSQGNFGRIPGQIAERLRGRQFRNFGEFRQAFWREVAADPHLASQFIPQNRGAMAAGFAPSPLQTQMLGGQQSYILHHLQPIQHGGGVYDLDNIAVVTPLYHRDILDPAFHF